MGKLIRMLQVIGSSSNVPLYTGPSNTRVSQTGLETSQYEFIHYAGYTGLVHGGSLKLYGPSMYLKFSPGVALFPKAKCT